jgi:hypothetical protein
MIDARGERCRYKLRWTDVVSRGSRVVFVVASVWFAFASFLGVFAIPGDGHLGAGGAGNTMAAEQIVRWRIPYPAFEWYTGAAPSKAAYICHHPYGQYYIPAFFLWIFGHRDFVVHLPAALMSAAMPPMLYGIAKARWGRPIGAVAAAAYSVVPIAVGFSNFTNLETFTIFGALLFFWGHSAHMRTGKARHLWASVAGVVLACAGDWVGYLILAPVLGWSFMRAFVAPARATPWFRRLPYAAWWALSVSATAATLFLWVALFHHADALQDWLSAGGMRSAGNELPLLEVLQARKNWLYFSFTPLAIRLGEIAAPICLLRIAVYRADEETYALALLGGAVIQYVKFKEGADIHIFWAHYFAPYFALALAQLAATVGAVVGWAVRRFSASSASRAPAVATAVGLIVGLAPVTAMAHDGVASLWVWRRTGGRYDDNGNDIWSHADTLEVIQDVVMPKTTRGMALDVHPGVEWYWHHAWKWQGGANAVAAPLASSTTVPTHPFWIGRSTRMSSDEVRKVAASTHLRIYGPVLVVDQREEPALLDAYSMNEHEPNVFQWFLWNPTEPVRAPGTTPDPWLTWEWRRHVGQPASLPMGAPSTLDEMRIAHNMAVSVDDSAGAARWKKEILAKLDGSVAAPFDHGVDLLGVRLTRGVEPRVETWFECTGPMGDASFNVRSTVEKQERFSLVPPDTTDREMARGPVLPSKLWQKGMIYETFAVLNHRIGVERYWGYWAPRDASLPPPRRVDGKPETTLVTVP